jgi:hypothetical protein
LAKVDTVNGNVTVIGTIGNGICNSLCWRDSDGKLNSYIVYGSGPDNSPYKASLVTIDPNTAAMTTLFETPYHTIAGLAQRPGRNAYVSWINADTAFYGEVNLDTKSITQLAPHDAGVCSAAMIYRGFYVAPDLQPPRNLTGRIT